MQSGDPVPAITEDAAVGEVAVLYADIRRTLGVPLVNLIWRNLATVPGALAWGWGTVKPLYESGRIQDQALVLSAGVSLPDVSPWPVVVLRAGGIGADAEQVIRGILESYERSNPLNLIALCALLAILRNETAEESMAAPAFSPQPALRVKLPVLVNLHEVPDDVAGLVRAVNRLGARGRDHILVSMPRHLAHWPGFLALYWTLIEPLDRSGELHRCADAVQAEAKRRGAWLARHADRMPLPPPDIRATIEATLDDFCRNAISRMIPVVRLLGKAMPESLQSFDPNA